MFAAVQAPGQIVAPTTGLLASAVRPTDPDAQWQYGFTWRPTRCITSAGFDVCGDLDTRPDPPDTGFVYVRPVGYYVEEECSTIGGGPDLERVRQQGEAAASFHAARELWSGTLTKTQPYDAGGASGVVNPHLASTDAAVVGTGLAPAHAMGLIEQAARVASRGQQVFLHVPIFAVPLLPTRRVGNLLYSGTDAVVVADAGYDGSGPAGQVATPTVAWIYATGPVAVRMTELVLDDTSLDRGTNRRIVRASRVVAAQFDPCVHVAASFAISANTPPA